MNMSLYWDGVQMPSGKTKEIKKRSAQLRDQAARDLKEIGMEIKCSSQESSPSRKREKKK